MKRGVFWLIEESILAVPFEQDAVFGISKSGNNYNHRLLWDHVKPGKCNKPYDYYPRGRVEMTSKGKPVIYMNRNIEDKYLCEIMQAFEITEIPRIHYDGSEHYKCYIDRGQI